MPFLYSVTNIYTVLLFIFFTDVQYTGDQCTAADRVIYLMLPHCGHVYIYYSVGPGLFLIFLRVDTTSSRNSEQPCIHLICQCIFGIDSLELGLLDQKGKTYIQF